MEDIDLVLREEVKPGGDLGGCLVGSMKEDLTSLILIIACVAVYPVIGEMEGRNLYVVSRIEPEVESGEVKYQEFSVPCPRTSTTSRCRYGYP